MTLFIFSTKRVNIRRVHFADAPETAVIEKKNIIGSREKTSDKNNNGLFRILAKENIYKSNSVVV